LIRLAETNRVRVRRFARLLNDLVQEFVDGAPGKGETLGLVAGLYVPDWADTTERAS
jgi:hypothetical protein